MSYGTAFDAEARVGHQGHPEIPTKFKSLSDGNDLHLAATSDVQEEVVGLVLDPDAETLSCPVAFLPRQVDDADMNATPGVFGELVVNVADSKAYLCTVAHETAATWAALN